MTNWQSCKNILCILPDDMGNLIMTGPALRALKESFGARVTALTSSIGEIIVKDMPEIDDTIIFGLPWMRTPGCTETADINDLLEELKKRSFDAAVIFSRYNQNTLPAAMLSYLAGIPKRLGCCRENPHQLLTDWMSDTESDWNFDAEGSHSFIKHHADRSLKLVATVNAITGCERFALKKNVDLWPDVKHKLASIGVDTDRRWIIMHPGVNDVKREYPDEKWIEAGKKIIDEFGCQVILTGWPDEKLLTDHLQKNIGPDSFSAAGLFDLGEFVLLIDRAPLVISVNTGTIHIASAVSTPVVVLYALADPQHVPWRSPCKVLKFEHPAKSRDEGDIIRLADNQIFERCLKMPSADDVLKAASDLLKCTSPEFIEPTLKHAG